MKRIHSYMITAVAAMSLFAGCIPPANQTNGAGGANPAAQGPFGSATTLVFLGGMILVFWLFFIRPQAKRAKNQKKFIEEPDYLKDLKKIAREGDFMDAGETATGKHKDIKTRTVFFKKIGERWFIENKLQEERPVEKD